MSVTLHSKLPNLADGHTKDECQKIDEHTRNIIDENMEKDKSQVLVSGYSFIGRCDSELTVRSLILLTSF